MPSTTVRYNQITNVAALSVVGNAGASEGRGANLSGTQVRTLCGLGTTDTPQWAGATLTGDLLFNANNSYDIGNGTYNPRTVRAATSVLTPLVNNASAALTLGNSTYGVTVPGAATFTGDISMQKATQGYIRAYATDGVKNVAISHNGSNGAFTTSSGANTFFSGTGQHYFFDSTGTKYLLFTQSGNAASITSIASAASYLQIVTESGQVTLYSTPSNSTLYVMSAGGANYTTLTTGTNSVVSNYSGNINLVPTGGTVAVTGGITASGAIQETYRTSSLDPTVSDIGSGKRQGWYNTSSLEFRDWVNVSGTLLKSAAYT